MATRNEKTMRPLAEGELAEVCGAQWNQGNPTLPGSRVLSRPGYKAPTVLLDDGVNIQTTDPSTTNVGYDSPFTPIPA